MTEKYRAELINNINQGLDLMNEEQRARSSVAISEIQQQYEMGLINERESLEMKAYEVYHQLHS